MIDLTLLARELYQFLEADPDGTAEQFTTQAVAAELGTEDDVGRFLAAVYDKLVTSCFIDEATWTAMITRLSELIAGEGTPGEGLQRFDAVLIDAVNRGSTEPEFQEIDALNKVEGFTAAIDDLMAKQTRLISGTTWVEQNMPAGEEKNAILEAIDFGTENLIDAALSFYTRERDEAQAILDDL
jgi:hypothetical protein